MTVQSIGSLASLLDTAAAQSRAREQAQQAARRAVQRSKAAANSRPGRGGRAVLLDPGTGTPRMAALAFAVRCGLQVVCVAGTLADAMHEIVHHRADMILALRTADLRPLIRIVTDPDVEVPAAQRRPVRRSR